MTRTITQPGRGSAGHRDRTTYLRGYEVGELRRKCKDALQGRDRLLRKLNGLAHQSPGEILALIQSDFEKLGMDATKLCASAEGRLESFDKCCVKQDQQFKAMVLARNNIAH